MTHPPQTTDPPSPAPFTLRELLVQAALAALPLLIVFPGVFLRGEIIWPGDILYAVEPWASHAPAEWERPQNPVMSDVLTAFHAYHTLNREALDEGAWPLWNPYQGGGMPLLANCQSVGLYPPRLLFDLFDIPYAATLYILLKLWLCGMTAYVCARGLGLGRPASRLFGFAWMLGGYNLYWANWPLPDVAAWMPLVFLSVEWILRGQYRRGTLGLGASGALLLLAGHPETAFTLGFGAGVYFAVRLALGLRDAPAPWRPIAAASAGWTLALLITAPLLLPFAEYLWNSYTFHDRDGWHEASSLPVNALISLWAHRFFGTNADYTFWGTFETNRHAIYIGVTMWIGVFLCLPLTLGADARRRRIMALLFSALFMLLLAFPTPSLAFLKDAPGLSSLRQNYYIAFALFALPLAGAMGIEAWIEGRTRARAMAGVLLGLCAIAGVLWTGWRFYADYATMLGMRDAIFHEFTMLGLAAAAALALLTLGFRARGRRRELVWAALTALLCAELMYQARGANVTLPARDYYVQPELIAFLRERPEWPRVEPNAARIPNGVLTPRGVEEWLGYDGLYPMRLHRLLNALGPELWASMEPIMGVRYYLENPELSRVGLLEGEVLYPALKDPGYFREIARIEGVRVLENQRAYPRVFLARTYAHEAELDAIFERMREPDYDPSAVALTDLAPPEPPPVPGTGPLGGAEVIARGTDYVQIAANITQECVLVLADAHYPGWQAYVNGARTAHFPAYTIWRGIVLPPGEHTVEFRYEPWTFRAGLALSALTLLGGLLYGLRRMPAGAAWRRGNAG